MNRKEKKLSQAILYDDVSLFSNNIHHSSNKLLLNNKDITKIDEPLPENIQEKLCSSCTSLLLSYNNISELKGLRQFQVLKNLSLAYNKVSEWDQIKNIPQDIETLSLEGNPITQHPDYRHSVIAKFPHMKMLDSISVTEAEKKNIELSRRLEVEYVRLMMKLQDIHETLWKEVSQLSIKLEIYRRAYGTHYAFARYEPPEESNILNWYASRPKIIKNCINHPEGKLRPSSILQYIESVFDWSAIVNQKDHYRYYYQDDPSQNWNNGIGNSTVLFRSLEQSVFCSNSSNFNSQDEEFFAAKLMEDIGKIYESKNFQRAKWVLQENGFKVYCGDNSYLQILLNLLFNYAKSIGKLESQRELLLETNLYALNIMGSKNPKFWQRKHPVEEWRDVVSRPIQIYYFNQETELGSSSYGIQAVPKLSFWGHTSETPKNEEEIKYPIQIETMSQVKKDLVHMTQKWKMASYENANVCLDEQLMERVKSELGIKEDISIKTLLTEAVSTIQKLKTENNMLKASNDIPKEQDQDLERFISLVSEHERREKKKPISNEHYSNHTAELENLKIENQKLKKKLKKRKRSSKEELQQEIQDLMQVHRRELASIGGDEKHTGQRKHSYSNEKADDFHTKKLLKRSIKRWRAYSGKHQRYRQAFDVLRQFSKQAQKRHLFNGWKQVFNKSNKNSNINRHRDTENESKTFSSPPKMEHYPEILDLKSRKKNIRNRNPLIIPTFKYLGL